MESNLERQAIINILKSDQPMYEVVKQYNRFFYWMEKVLSKNQALSDSQLKEKMLKFIEATNPARMVEKEFIEKAIDTYLLGGAVVESNKQMAQQYLTAYNQEKVNESLKKAVEFNLDNCSIFDLEASVIKQRGKYASSLYNAFQMLLEGRTDELKSHGKFGQFLADSLDVAMNTKSITARSNFLKILTTMIPTTSTMQTLEYLTSKKESPEQKQFQNNKNIQDYFNKLKKS